MYTGFICVLCGNNTASFVNNLWDDDKRWAVCCDSCGHIQMTPLPTIDEDNAFYQSNAMHRLLTPESMRSDSDLMYRQEPYGVSQADWTCRFLQPELSIFEIGSGYGWFIQKMKEKGFQRIDGVELSDNKREMVRSRASVDLFGFNLLTEQCPSEVEHNYDALCIFHLLEHVPDPVLFLKKAAICLKASGKLIVEVPNVDDFLKQECSEYNDFMYVRAHVSYFSVKTLIWTIQEAGFRNIKVFGKQIYSIENAIHWMRNKKPFLASMQVEVPTCLEYVNKHYKSEQEKALTSDTLFATAEL